MDPLWAESFRTGHGGREPTEQDWQDHLLSLGYPGTGPEGAWSEADWAVYHEVQATLGSALLSRIGRRGGLGAAFYTALGALLALFRLQPGPDGTRVALGRPFPRGPIPPRTGGWTLGNVIILPQEEAESRRLLTHEYVHVLQYRETGILYGYRYARQRFYDWTNNVYEQQAVKVEGLYRTHPWLPPLWEMHWVGTGGG